MGGAINAGGIAGVIFNNATISNTNVKILKGNIVAERRKENETASAYGAHVAGIVGRLEHTGRINDCTVIGDNIMATANEKNNYIGGIVGANLGPFHKKKISLENNLVDGNNNSTLSSNFIEGNNAGNLYIGALAGSSFYVIKNNTVKNLSIKVTGVTKQNKQINVSNYIGDYRNVVNHLGSTKYFTPDNSEIINPVINNINIDLGFSEELINVKRY